MESLAVLKIAFLLMGVWWTLVLVALMVNKEDIPWLNFLLPAVGIVGFAVLQFNLYQ